MKFKMDELYRIKFSDHCVGMSDKMKCEAVGWVIKEAKDYVVITAWITLTDDKQVKKDNVEPVTILKACITSKRKLS